MGFTRDGSLFFGTEIQHEEAYTIDIDTSTWTTKGQPKPVTERFINTNQAPAWSSDGRFLAYVSNRKHISQFDPGDITFVMHPIDSSGDREFTVPYGQVATSRAFRWFPDGKSLLLGQYGPQGSGHFRRLDLVTGNVTEVFRTPPRNPAFIASVSADGNSIFHMLKDSATEDPKSPGIRPRIHLVRRNLATGKETVITTVSAWVLHSISASPDGQFVAFFAPCTTKPSAPVADDRCVWVVPARGGEPRQLRPPKDRFINPGFNIAWTPGNTGVFISVATKNSYQAARGEIWYVPLNSSEPHRLAIQMDYLDLPDVHPSGNQLAFTARRRTGAISVLTNFLPKTQAAK